MNAMITFTKTMSNPPTYEMEINNWIDNITSIEQCDADYAENQIMLFGLKEYKSTEDGQQIIVYS